MAYRKRLSLSFCLIALLLVVSGCATPQARLSDVPQVSDDLAMGRLYVGPFVDKREYSSNFSTEHLGTVRGGFGNVLMRVTDWRGADEFVREHVVNAARFSRYVADRTPDGIIVSGNGEVSIVDSSLLTDMRPIVAGVINTLAVDAGGSRRAVIDIDIALVDPTTGSLLNEQLLSKTETAGMGGGIAEDVELLKNWLAKLVQDESLTYLGTENAAAGIHEIAGRIEQNVDSVKVAEPPGGALPEFNLPEGDFFYTKGGDYHKMTPVDVSTQESYRQVWAPFSFKGGETFFYLEGNTSASVLSGQGVAFYTTINPSTLRLVHLGKKEKLAKRYVVFMNYRSDREVPFDSELVGRNVFKIVPVKSLVSGEYAFFTSGEQINAYDFTVR